MRTGMFPQTMGTISGATETTEKRMKMSPENLKAIGTKAARWEMRTSLTRRSTPSMLSRPTDTDATEMKTQMIQLSAGTTCPATGARAIKTRRRRKLCPVSITNITSSGRPTEATEKRKMKTRKRRMSPLGMDSRSTDARTAGSRRTETAQRNTTAAMAPATDMGATKMTMMAVMLSPPSTDIKSTGTEIMGRRRRRKMTQRNITTTTAPATDTGATKKKMMMKMILSPLSTDIKSTGTEIMGRRRRKMTQRNITTITAPATDTGATKKKKMIMKTILSPLSTDIKSTDTEIMGRRRRRLSQRNIPTITAPATDTGAMKKMMMKMKMMLSPPSTDIKYTGTEIMGRRRMKMTQRNITTIMVATRKTRMRICPRNTGTRPPDIPTMALEMRRRRRRKRRSQSSSATMLQAPNPKATRALRRRTSQKIIKKQSLAMTTMESPRRKMRTSLPGLATRLPATGSKTTEMRGLATEGPSRKR